MIKKVLTLWGMIALVGLSIWLAGLFVLAHFISKFW